MPSMLFVDTSGWYAAFSRKDPHHQAVTTALREARAVRRSIVTSDYVLDETLTLARVRGGHTLAVRIGDAIWHRGGAHLLEVDAACRELAWKTFLRFAEHDLSFTDCTSAALMRSRGIDEVVTLDHHFAVLGFVQRPER